jgi:glycosyltransferase involved in cell wall biosynthesis
MEMGPQVRSKYLSNKHRYEFFIRRGTPFFQYMYLANNDCIYHVVLEEETVEDIWRLHETLCTKKKNPEFRRTQLILHGSKKEHEEACRSVCPPFLYEPVTDRLLSEFTTPDYIPTKCEAPAWKYKNRCTLMNYFEDETLQIIRFHGFEQHWDVIPYLHSSQYVFVNIPSMFGKWNFEFALNVLFTRNPTFPKDHLIWESNELDTMLCAIEYGFPSIFCNHNCWIDTNLFRPSNVSKHYDMVMNCRPERNMKRPYLAKMVSNLAYIKGSVYRPNDLYDVSELKCAFTNETRLTPEEVVNVYRQSVCGGIFSAEEGACYSSSEYLLCGLPVVSTASRGGRDIWYTPENSILVEPDEMAVKDAVDTWIQRTKAGLVDPERIRSHHILLATEMRDRFIDTVQTIFDKHGIDISARDHFQTRCIHKMYLQYSHFGPVP